MDNLNPLSSKPHYPILDGLRGIAAVVVFVFHLLMPHGGSLDPIVNHGYLAVDFFFLLSGFVIGYAYDDRWPKMTPKDFFLRRLIRLQPMVVLGMIIGAVSFYFQECQWWPGLHAVPPGRLLLTMFVGFTLMPMPGRFDIRGTLEMYPLNAAVWSLFYEYIANLLYALVVRKFSRTWLTILVLIAAAALVHCAVTCQPGDFMGGWSLYGAHPRIAFTRLLFSFFAGLLLFRVVRLRTVKHGFTWCSLLLIAALAFPGIGRGGPSWQNGIYESACIILVFPLIVFLGAGGALSGQFSTRLCKFLGDISYPLYITHLPLVFVYIAWVTNHPGASTGQILPRTLATFTGAILLAYASVKLYDEPVRKWLRSLI